MKSLTSRPAVLWRYVIPHDGGLVPHISGGMCSLAVCKPKIRRYANPGEWVIGLATKEAARGSAVIKLAMKVAGTPTFANYCAANLGRRRDAIYDYRPGGNGAWIDNGYADHRPAFGDCNPGAKDKSGKHVLVASEFVHFGKGCDLLKALAPICHERRLDPETVVEELHHRSQSESKYCTQVTFTVFVEWLNGIPRSGKPPAHHQPWPNR